MMLFSSRLQRSGGLLLHPSSLPGNYGIGDLGPSAFSFIDFLHASGIKVWQILPLGPTGYGNSPYQCLSAFAGNTLLISPEILVEYGLLSIDKIKPGSSFPDTKVDFDKVIPFKNQLIESAYERFLDEKTSNQQRMSVDFEIFIKENDHWLDDYSLYLAVKKAHDLEHWSNWDEEYRLHNPKTLIKWKKEHQKTINRYKFSQYLFFSQWKNLHDYCKSKKISIIGDIPLFVSHDSADVWANREQFYVNKKGKPIYVAGVPPDYFSETGQLWGNPLYRWKSMKENDYDWWTRLLKHWFSKTEMLRIDHFRGFEAYWQIPACEETATNGKWIKGPGIGFFLVVSKQLGHLPVIAEDLGTITPGVRKLLKQTGFPGMKVLQFAFGSDEPEKNPYIPENYKPNSVVYTGTHDNNTTAGWFENAPEKEQERALKYLESDGQDIVGDFIRAAWSSKANLAIIPLQDLLRIGEEGRMNLPGSLGGNWEWRFTWDQLTEERSNELVKLNEMFNR